MEAQSFESRVHGASLSLLPRDFRDARCDSSATLSCDFRTLTARRDSLAQALPAQSMKVAATLNPKP